jgi:thioredoxin 1
VVVAFWADWNVPCRIAAPAMEEAARRTAGRVRFGIVAYDDNPGLAERYEVRGLPTYLVFRNGEVCERRVGLMGRRELARIVESCAG